MNADILIIGGNRKSITYIGVLAGYGYRIAEAHSIEDAYDVLMRETPPAIILETPHAADYIPSLRTLTSGRSNIIVVSGSEVDAYGADVFLQIPFKAEDVLLAVRHGAAQ